MHWTMAWNEEVTEVLDRGLAWAMADQKAMDLANHSGAEQQRLKIYSESQGRRRTCGRCRTTAPQKMLLPMARARPRRWRFPMTRTSGSPF